MREHMREQMRENTRDQYIPIFPTDVRAKKCRAETIAIYTKTT